MGEMPEAKCRVYTVLFHSFIYLFCKHLLRVCHVSGPMPSSENLVLNKTDPTPLIGSLAEFLCKSPNKVRH